MKILLLNGPNLNLLGEREPDVYGSTTLADVTARCAADSARWGVELDTFQSNHEGTLIDRLHAARGSCDGIVFNPGAFTHYSYALHDAVAAVAIPTVEVHISDIMRRERWRRRSVIAPAAVRTIYGRGLRGYSDAVRLLVALHRRPPTTISYGSHHDQVGDLRIPADPGPHPVVVLLHGGLWRHSWARDLMEPAAVDMAGRGWATWNVEYRRVGSGGGWPATMEDAAAAIDAVIDLADDHRLDASDVTVVGHSAGGQLALWSGARCRLPADCPGAGPRLQPQRILALAPIAHLAAAYAADVGDGAVADLLRRSPPHDRYSKADPAALGPWTVPTTIIHGADDSLVPTDLATEFVAAVGGPIEVRIEPGVGHFDVIDPAGEAWKAVITALEASYPRRRA